MGPNRAQRDDLYLFAEANTALQLTESWLIRAIVTLEPLADPYPGKNRAFENEDVRWKDVFIQYDNGVAGFRGGRITADFGFAWYGRLVAEHPPAKNGVPGWPKQYRLADVIRRCALWHRHSKAAGSFVATGPAAPTS